MAKRTFRRLLLAAAGVFVSLPAAAKADELSQLKEELKQTQELLMKLQQRVEQLEAQQTEQEKVIEKQAGVIKKIDEKKYTPASIASWAEKIKFYGDFRFRHEHRDQESVGTEQKGRSRQRIRVRLGMKADINKELDFHLRLATGQGATSTNETLGDGFEGDGIYLDRAYIDYRPEWMNGTTILAGKFGLPFIKPGGSQLLFDSDLNPEGGALKYEKKISDNLTAYANIGAFWIEMLDSNFNQSLWGAQIAAKYRFSEKTSLLTGLSYYDYGNLKDKDLIGGNALGNTTNGTSPDSYRYEYQIVEAFAQLDTQLMDMPFSFFGDFVQNIASSVNEDTGYLFGFKLNKAKEKGDWQFGYDYRELQRDATVGAFSESDFIGGGTGGSGHKFGVKYKFADNVTGAVSYFINERDNNSSNAFEDDYKLLQFDVNVKF
jgi:hypothetical protein